MELVKFIIKCNILQIMSKSYWLMKSEPDVWSIDQQKKAGPKGAALGWCKKLSSSKKFKKYEKR